MNDLERVTKQIYSMVTYLGMSDKLPNLSYYDSSGEAYGFTKPYSDETALLIDKEVHSMIATQYERAKSLLREHADGHHRLTNILIEKEVIFSDDLKEIFGEREWISRSEEILTENQKGEVPPPPYEEAQIVEDLAVAESSSSEGNAEEQSDKVE